MIRLRGETWSDPYYLLVKFLILLIFLATALFATWYFISQPTFSENSPSKATVEAERLKTHVLKLTDEFYPRSFLHPEHLDGIAEYIARHFQKAGADSVENQHFKVGGNQYTNVSAIFGKGKSRRLIVGAHYDAFDDTPGADDNASGIAGIIELAYLLGEHGTDREIEIVAYSLEEPPFFATKKMGSYAHASLTKQNGNNVDGVIVFEMIGFFSDEEGSQEFPVPLLKLFYPGTGNFIAVVGAFGQGGFTKRVKAGMKGATDLPVFSLNASSAVPGVDFSDHRNYWIMGLNAVMVTDTGFYRNRAYHTLEDTAERLDYERMGKVVVGVFEALKKL